MVFSFVVFFFFFFLLLSGFSLKDFAAMDWQHGSANSALQLISLFNSLFFDSVSSESTESTVGATTLLEMCLQVTAVSVKACADGGGADKNYTTKLYSLF